MSNTIQNYYFKDMSSYGINARLNISIGELISRQTEESTHSLRVVSKDNAATIEISELARAMYGESLKTPVKQENVNTMDQPAKEPEGTGKSKGASNSASNGVSNDVSSYEEAVEREIKELEDYIASHPADPSINVLRNTSLV